MYSFWIWLAMLLLAWTYGLLHLSGEFGEQPWRLAASALLFCLFFAAPLFKKNPIVLLLLLTVAMAAAVGALWPDGGNVPNPYVLIVFSLLAGKAAIRLPLPHMLVVGTVGYVSLLAQSLWATSSYSLLFITLYAALNLMGLAFFRMIHQRTEELSSGNEALLSEYRNMKRRLITAEQLARQEERAQVGRDIHDSVGHKLTALLMQLEVFRMQASESTQPQVQQLKELAKESLEETRNAVQSLKRNELGGLSAILRLLRTLEAESFIRINFSVKHGALSAPLRSEQSIAVYRAVQEALTNMMRHSNAREADIRFETPGGGVFRFEVSNALKENKPLREGFGLQSMRERIERTGGKLDIIAYDGLFTVRGTLPMLNNQEES
ncbi:sensor histidine kinase [Paenibacillaceae bacterium]|nr:sensor histidine kinase [Paenibacillaceae bacterium]